MAANATSKSLLVGRTGKHPNQERDAPAELTRAGADASYRPLADHIHRTMQAGPEQASYTYGKDARLVLVQVYTYLLDLAAKKRAHGGRDAPPSSKEVQDDES